jgi:hypothetical protein
MQHPAARARLHDFIWEVMLRQLFSSSLLFGGTCTNTKRCWGRRRRLRFETLEERTVLSGLWFELDHLTAGDGMADDELGYDVAIDGDTMVVGSPFHNDAAGAAYVFAWDGTNWTEQAKLTAANASAGDGLGLDVDIDGDTIIVGGSGDDDVVADSGAAWIFVRQGDVWSEQAKLKASDPALYDLFGIKVALDGDTAIVGAPFDDDDGLGSGSAYVFQRAGQSWTQQTKLTASDAAQFDRFGVSVDIDNGAVIVGADSNDDAGSFSGSAYVFTENAGGWNEQAKLTASDAAATDQFGFSVAIDGDTVVVGAFWRRLRYRIGLRLSAHRQQLERANEVDRQRPCRAGLVRPLGSH